MKRGILGEHIGAVLYEGPSELDGAPIVVVATGFKTPPSVRNAKLGNIIQTWIFRSDQYPNDAIVYGTDSSVCGDCKLRGPACYVNVGMVDRIYDAYYRGRYLRDVSPEQWAELLAGRRVRLGAYGDPSAVPYEAWAPVFENAEGWIGYTHLWRQGDPAYKNHLMASVDTPQERTEAKRAGWRTFRTRFKGERLQRRNEIACPASAEGGKRTTCEKCMLCNGENGPLDKRKSVAIIVHGWSTAVTHYTRVRAGLEVVA